MSSTTGTVADLAAVAGKYLTFFLDTEEYGIGILKVQEIIGFLPITPVPRTPAFMRGVVNLRGKIIPVVDLRLKLGMEGRARTVETCIIVVRTGGTELGVIVDKVSEVLNVQASELDPPPAMGAAVDTACLLGVGKSNGKVRLLLDIDRVLSKEELVGVRDLSGGPKG